MTKQIRTSEKIAQKVQNEDIKKYIPELEVFINNSRDKYIGIINIDYITAHYLLAKYGTKTNQKISLKWSSKNYKPFTTKII